MLILGYIRVVSPTKCAETIPNSAPRQDTLAQVMQMCKHTSGTDAFIRSMEVAPEPMCVLVRVVTTYCSKGQT